MGLRETLAKTRAIFSRLTLAPRVNTEDLTATLLAADVGINATQQLIETVKHTAGNPTTVLRQEIAKILSRGLLTKPSVDTPPEVIMVVGVNGSGKTTTIGKLCHYYTSLGKRVIVAAGDTYRDAAAEQLAIWAERAKVEIVRSQKGQDAAAVAFDTLCKAQEQNFDIVFIDTAGRLHTRKDLMAEVEKIKRVCTKVKPGAPDEIWLIMDATVGQNGIQQAKTFNQHLKLSGIIITKLDGTAKGGVIVPVVMELELPIKFIGTGEGLNDLEPFNPEEYARALLD